MKDFVIIVLVLIFSLSLVFGPICIGVVFGNVCGIIAMIVSFLIFLYCVVKTGRVEI